MTFRIPACTCSDQQLNLVGCECLASYTPNERARFAPTTYEVEIRTPKGWVRHFGFADKRAAWEFIKSQGLTAADKAEKWIAWQAKDAKPFTNEYVAMMSRDA